MGEQWGAIEIRNRTLSLFWFFQKDRDNFFHNVANLVNSFDQKFWRFWGNFCHFSKNKNNFFQKLTNDNSLLYLQGFSLANINKLTLKNDTLIEWGNSSDPNVNQLLFSSKEYLDYIVNFFFFFFSILFINTFFL